MRVLITYLLVFCGVWVFAQSHSVALSGGTSYITSFNGENPISAGSPWEPRLGGLTLSLEYSFTLQNGIFFNVRSNFSQLNLFDEKAILFSEITNDFTIAEQDLYQSFFTNSLGTGYLFEINRVYDLGLEVGGSMFYHYKSVANSDQVSNSRIEIEREWKSDNIYFGVYLENNHYFRIYKSRKTEVHLLTGVRTTTAFDYMREENSPRLLPELFLGVELQLK
jgi:hypothetical protein